MNIFRLSNSEKYRRKRHQTKAVNRCLLTGEQEEAERTVERVKQGRKQAIPSLMHLKLQRASSKVEGTGKGE